MKWVRGYSWPFNVLDDLKVGPDWPHSWMSVLLIHSFIVTLRTLQLGPGTLVTEWDSPPLFCISSCFHPCSQVHKGPPEDWSKWSERWAYLCGLYYLLSILVPELSACHSLRSTQQLETSTNSTIYGLKWWQVKMHFLFPTYIHMAITAVCRRREGLQRFIT